MPPQDQRPPDDRQAQPEPDFSHDAATDMIETLTKLVSAEDEQPPRMEAVRGPSVTVDMGRWNLPAFCALVELAQYGSQLLNIAHRVANRSEA